MNQYQIWQLYERVGLSKFHLRDSNKACEYEQLIERFVYEILKANEENQSSADRALITEMVGVLEGIEHFSDAVDFSSDPLDRALSQWIRASVPLVARARSIKQ